MAGPTRITDIIVPSVFTPYVQLKTMELSALAKSGIIVPDPRIDALAKGGGRTINMPFWSDLTGDSDVGSDDPSDLSTPDKLTATQDVTVKHFRAKSWSEMDLAAELAGDDPARVMADSVAGFWARDLQHMLIATLKGVFAANAGSNSSDMIYSIASDANSPIQAAEIISPTAVLLARQTMGDAASNLTAIAVHSAVYTELLRQNIINFLPTNVQNIGWGTYLNMTVIVDDGCPADAGTYRITYTSYIFGQGAFGYGEGAPQVPTETFRTPGAGNGTGMDTLYNRKSFIMHPRGVKWTASSMAGAAPTNAELAAAANWNRVYDRKHVRLVALKTNG
jgi:hypothetical protein